MVPSWTIVLFHYPPGPSLSEEKDNKNVDRGELWPKGDIKDSAKNVKQTEKELGRLVKKKQRKREEKEREGLG